MRLLELLREPLVRVGLRAATKEAAIEALLDVLIETGEVRRDDRARIIRAVFDRERSRATGMEHGIALPHGAIEGIDEVSAALGIAPAGIDFGAADGLPAQIVLLLVIPQNLLQFHVKTLAGIARLLNDESLRERLVASRTASEAIATMRARECTPEENGRP